MGSLKVDVHVAHGNVEVQFLALMQDSGEQVDQQAISCIFVGHELDFHCPELHSPPDGVIDWNFEPHGILIRPIEHLKDCVLVITHFLKVLVHD